MKKISSLLFASLILLCGISANSQESFQGLKDCAAGDCLPRPEPRIIERRVFIPQIIVKPNYQPITIQDLSIKTDVVGNVATTTYEMVLHNPNQAVLEAEFEFPLNERQTVAAIALDINGNMREGVVVEKQKARQTFEAVVRQGADPLLVEKTAGNQFKTRIYPFAANGNRKIRIILEEPLSKEKGQFKYVLPLNFKTKLAHFNLDINLPIKSENPPEVTTDLAGFHFTRVNQIFQSHFEASDYELNNSLSFNIPQTEENQVFTHKADENKTYFYTNVDLEPSEKLKTLPKKIAVVWDSSLSGEKRNIAKEKELLSAYLKRLGDVSVMFVPFSIDVGNAQNIDIKGGDAASVLAKIDEVIYDGATSFGQLSLDKLEVDEILLFTDGLNTFESKANLKLPNVPVYIINSSPEYASGRLKGWASKTFASFINLVNTSTENALKQLVNQPLRIIEYKSSEVSEVYPIVGTEVDENISVAGILNGSQTDLEIVLGYDKNNVQQTKKITIEAKGNNPAVERLWAQQKIADLEQNAEENKEAILELGQEYSIVTEGTSLLVLENAADYFRYNITPPDELREEYDRLQRNKASDIKMKKTSALSDALRQANNVKEWWNHKFPKRPKPNFDKIKKIAGLLDYVTEDDGAAGSRSVVTGAGVDVNSTMDGYSLGEDVAFMDQAGAPTMAQGRRIQDRNGVPLSSETAAPVPSSSIQIRQWDPDVPYLKILKASKNEELYSDYLKLKKGYSDQPSFYFDITDEFIRRNQYKEGLKVLSNIVEMKLDNAELVRIVANKLMQMEKYDKAVDLFKKAVELRGEDPQSFRELALAYQANGDYQKAFDTFYHILENDWGRFNEIKQIIFVEMNNLLSLHPEVDTKGMNEEFIFNMPVDVRIVLAWSTDNTDIDLHVVDPFGEECFYGHKQTETGGRYPFDFTGGFGPEEFMLKRGAKGKYTVRTNNFGDHRQSISGPTTLYLDLYTNYSTPEQKHERVFVRTENVKERNSIGEITFGE